VNALSRFYVRAESAARRVRGARSERMFAALGPVARLLAWAERLLVVSHTLESAVLGALLSRVFRARVISTFRMSFPEHCDGVGPTSAPGRAETGEARGALDVPQGRSRCERSRWRRGLRGIRVGLRKPS